MTTIETHDPFFVAITAPEFRRDQISDLAAGRCAAIRVADFLPSKTCSDILNALMCADFEYYGTERVYPPVMRFGVGVSDYRKDGKIMPDYWDALRRHQDSWSTIGLDFDPLELCRETLGKHWPGVVAIGRNEGRELGGGVAREPNQGFVVHFDDAQREFSGSLLDAHIVAQFAFNLYLSVPEQGGETVVWRHRWRPADEKFRFPGSYGYTDAVVGDAEHFVLKPKAGEALLFDPRNFHAVRPSVGSRRIALGFSVGLSDRGDLYTWG
ncbi:2OG-Fe(II)-dependent halogenase WelO5 family protein [Microbispora sp. ATCC PTA-5024]|uniref:2OG-Fe(II)-dependent halogenase WelO5 family protein n=1 Tax=Microbispora sp. ATCC PTA-5024 TaxID=316330 RepID=UPI0003DC2D60|nr:2OG-Fe(II) oxygenase [Microbispora sp. ATCC PTA-5024]ETK33351.1 prolyl 4-hydroxylase subunit alpha [Microbispora sp. ATCC PTA-5024]